MYYLFWLVFKMYSAAFLIVEQNGLFDIFLNSIYIFLPSCRCGSDDDTKCKENHTHSTLSLSLSTPHTTSCCDVDGVVSRKWMSGKAATHLQYIYVKYIWPRVFGMLGSQKLWEAHTHEVQVSRKRIALQCKTTNKTCRELEYKKKPNLLCFFAWRSFSLLQERLHAEEVHRQTFYASQVFCSASYCIYVMCIFLCVYLAKNNLFR